MDAGGEFQGTVEEGGSSQESTRPNRFDAVAGLSGGNTDPAPWRTGLAIWNVRGHLEQQTGGNTYPGFKPPFTMG